MMNSYTVIETHGDRTEPCIQKFHLRCIYTVQKACFSNITSAVDRFITDSILVFFVCYTVSFVKRRGTGTNIYFTDTSKLIIPGIQLCSDHKNMTNLKMLKSNHGVSFKLMIYENNTWRGGSKKGATKLRFHYYKGVEETLSTVIQVSRDKCRKKQAN
jgi:hypothetical protein